MKRYDQQLTLDELLVLRDALSDFVAEQRAHQKARAKAREPISDRAARRLSTAEQLLSQYKEIAGRS